MRLHGRTTVRDPGEEEVPGEERDRRRRAPARARPARRPAAGPQRTAQDHLLAGRSATIERILVDYDDHVHLCVTVDDDPGQDLMRDIGRFLYFKPTEVEVIGS